MTRGRRPDSMAGRALAAGAALAVLLTTPSPGRLSAQDTPAIRAAVRLAAEGRTDSARTLIGAVLARARPGDPVYVEALFWRARLAAEGESADRDLRRIVIEFGNSAWADDALLQLTQLAIAAGNPAAAVEYVARLRTDYPGSDLRAKAALWGGRAAFDVGEPRTACALLDSAQAEGASDIEFLNQLHFYQSRCTPALLAAPPRADSVRASAPGRDTAAASTTAATPPPPAPPSPSPGAAARGFDVQVAAAKSDRQARAVVQRLQRSRRTAHIVVGRDGIRRVRVGPFPTMQAADSAAHALRRLVGGTPFPVRVP